MANISRKQWLLSRRHVLRGLGAAVALPALDCMIPRAAGAVPTGKPKRCAFIYLPNGVNTLTWQIEKSGRDYAYTSPMKSLEPFREDLSPISGLHHPNGIGQAHECDKIWLTGAKISQEGGAFRNTVSADQLMAEVAGQHTRFSSLELTVTGGSLAWSKDGIPLPAESRPGQVFERLFGEPPGGKEAARRRLNRRGGVVDVILDDARKLKKTIGSEDRSKLDEYLNAIREVERRTERAEDWLDKPKPKVDEGARAHLNRNIPQAEAGDYYRTMYDLMVLALQTDSTRVTTCMSGSENHGLAIPEIGVPQTRHELSHHNGDPEQLRRLTECDTFLVKQFAYFLGQLRSRREGGETLLDRTMVLFGSGMAYGHGHGNANLPILLAGGKALGLRHGAHVDFNLSKIGKYATADAKAHYGLCSRPADSGARLNNLLLTLLRKMDVAVDRFGDSVGALTEVEA